METNTEFNINDIFNIENIELTKEEDKLTGQIDNEFAKILDGEEKKEEQIYLTESIDGKKQINLSNEFERELYDELIQFNMLKESIDNHKAMIKEFIENNNVGSFKTDLIKVQYTSATTATSIDATRLKKELPKIAAEYSTVSARSSSIKLATNK